MHESDELESTAVIDSMTRDLRGMQLWPLAASLNVEGWLGNFTSQDRFFAESLLQSFVYLGKPLVNAHLIGAFQQVSVDVGSNFAQLSTAIDIWRSFCSSSLFVPVEGEISGPAESGNVLSRLVRDTLGIGENNILKAREALLRVKRGDSSIVVFVDDFSGTGLQFRDFWRRSFILADNTSYSFQLADVDSKIRSFFTPLVMTAKAYSQVSRDAPSVVLRPAHRIGPEYYASDPSSQLWPVGRAHDGVDFLKRQAQKLGLDRNSDRVLFGFGEMGLALAFEHGYPDATLPIFSWKADGFVPLLERGS